MNLEKSHDIITCWLCPDPFLPAKISDSDDSFTVSLRVQMQKGVREYHECNGKSYTTIKTSVFGDDAGTAGRLFVTRYGSKYSDKGMRNHISVEVEINEISSRGRRTSDGYLVAKDADELAPVFRDLENRLRDVITDRQTGKLNASGRSALKWLSQNNLKDSKGKERLCVTMDWDLGTSEDNEWRQQNA